MSDNYFTKYQNVPANNKFKAIVKHRDKTTPLRNIRSKFTGKIVDHEVSKFRKVNNLKNDIIWSNTPFLDNVQCIYYLSKFMNGTVSKMSNSETVLIFIIIWIYQSSIARDYLGEGYDFNIDSATNITKCNTLSELEFLKLFIIYIDLKL